MPFQFKADKKTKQVFDNYSKGQPATMAFVNSYEDGKQAVLTHTMTPLTSILKNEFGYSILVVLDQITAGELNKYDELGQRQIPNGFSYKKLIYDDDKMYLKLKVMDDKFTAVSFATPENYEEQNFEGTNLSVTYNMGVWVNFEKQSSGSFLKIVSITKV